jgi:hypothetical protein
MTPHGAIDSHISGFRNAGLAMLPRRKGLLPMTAQPSVSEGLGVRVARQCVEAGGADLRGDGPGLERLWRQRPRAPAGVPGSEGTPQTEEGLAKFRSIGEKHRSLAAAH